MAASNYAFQFDGKGKYHIPVRMDDLEPGQNLLNIETRCGKVHQAISTGNVRRAITDGVASDGCRRCAPEVLWTQLARENDPTPLELAEREVHVWAHRMEWMMSNWKGQINRVTDSLRRCADDIERYTKTDVDGVPSEDVRLIRLTGSIQHSFMWMIPNSGIHDAIRHAAEWEQAMREYKRAKEKYQSLVGDTQPEVEDN